MTTLCIILSIGFTVAVCIAQYQLNRAANLQRRLDAAANLYDQCTALEHYNTYLEARVSMTNAIYAGGMMHAGYIRTTDKMVVCEGEAA